MWMYEGPSDPTRVHQEELTGKTVEGRIKAITSDRDNPQEARKVPPYDRDHPLVEVNPCSMSRVILTSLFVCLRLTLSFLFQQSF